MFLKEDELLWFQNVAVPSQCLIFPVLSPEAGTERETGRQLWEYPSSLSGWSQVCWGGASCWVSWPRGSATRSLYEGLGPVKVTWPTHPASQSAQAAPGVRRFPLLPFGWHSAPLPVSCRYLMAVLSLPLVSFSPLTDSLLIFSFKVTHSGLPVPMLDRSDQQDSGS